MKRRAGYELLVNAQTGRVYLVDAADLAAERAVAKLFQDELDRRQLARDLDRWEADGGR